LVGSGELIASAYAVSAEAQDNLFGIGQRVAEDSVDLANRIDGEFAYSSR
jgi:hypothetical protein